MIIGGGVEQVPAYKRAKERGFSILGTDIDPNAPALKLRRLCITGFYKKS